MAKWSMVCFYLSSCTQIMIKIQFKGGVMILLSFVFAARVVTDRVSGYSKGFGFVRYATLEDAEAGIKGMDGQVSCDIEGNFLQL